MAFDTDTRKKLARMVADARTFLRTEFTSQLQEIYGIQPDGNIADIEKLSHLDDEQRDIARLLRERVVHLASSMGNEKKPIHAAIDRMTLEQSFTLLNRFAALRMCEERKFIQQCVGAGMDSEGFAVYLQIAGTGLGNRFDRYCNFIFCVFDEIAVDLGILFDRFSPFGLFFPRESALEKLLGVINQPELKHIWKEDEAIGWIYQYFNSAEERKAMRDASQAPRNSRELAVRNQFFTPRYVVEFLTDNTLGRIWYEMRKGNSALNKVCRYLVRRPNEIFLAPGEKIPATEECENNLSQEELLKRPVYIPYRPVKDPRNLKMLDPACGSMHFGLYAFDLFEIIYREAWEMEEQLGANALIRSEDLKSLHETYEDESVFLSNVPRLIIEHNINGIDIDPRAVQIAALALWLRAQKSWKNLGIKAAERPRIAKSNIVTAEPMPGDEDMRREFTTGLKPRVLGQIVDVVFDKMKLAGEAGSLLKIEEEIKNAVAKARKQWVEGPKPEQQILFPGMAGPRPKQQELLFDVKGITNELFWEQAEDRILEAMKEYAERTENGRAVRRRLFAEDAARGFAFIDLCLKRYDVVLMNPPFGSATLRLKEWFRNEYQFAAENLSVGMILRSFNLLEHGGLTGLIGDLPWLQQAEYVKFRNKLLNERKLKFFVELGWGILGTDVEVALMLFSGEQNFETAFVNLVGDENQTESLLNCFSNPNDMVVRDLSDFAFIENHPFAYQISDILLQGFRKKFFLKNELFEGAGGVAASEADRVFRCWWEVYPFDIGFNKKWSFCQNGSPYSPLYYPTYFLIRSDNSTFNTIKSYPNARTPNIEKYGKIGLAYGKRTSEMYTYPMPAGQVITWEGQALFPVKKAMVWHALGLTNSSLYSLISNLVAGQHKYSGYLNTICLDTSRLPNLSRLARVGYQSIRKIDELNEVSHAFLPTTLNNCLKRPAFDELVSASENDSEKILSEIDTFVSHSVGQQILKDRKKPSGGSYFSVLLESQSNERTLFHLFLSFTIGIVIGRWDVRIALDSSLIPKISDPFDPLPSCPPGMLVGQDGLPAETNRIVSEEWLHARSNANTLPPEGTVKNPTIPDSDYLLQLSWNGILVDDPGFEIGEPHKDDIVRRVREVFDLLWKDKAHEIEQEACEILSVSDLRDYFRKPTGFFQDHLKRYSKSRRKAPIYWPLSTESGSYTLWIYYHRLTDQTLFTCVNDYLKPKIEEVSRDMERLQKDLKEAGNANKRSQLEKLQDLRQELIDLRDELLRVSSLPYKPNLSDGVMITAAPLWKLFRHKPWQKELNACWKKLEIEKYDWAHLAYSIWPNRVKKLCKTDRSVAIAHDLEHLCEIEIKEPKKKKAKKN